MSNEQHQYRVEWVMDVEAGSHEEAAEFVDNIIFEHHYDNHSNVFQVRGRGELRVIKVSAGKGKVIL